MNKINYFRIDESDYMGLNRFFVSREGYCTEYLRIYRQEIPCCLNSLKCIPMHWSYYDSLFERVHDE